MMCSKCKSKFDKYIYHVEEMLDIGEPTFGRTIEQLKREDKK